MNPEFRADYFHDLKAKAAFERYAISIFRLDFAKWKAKGLWDKKYIAFSAFAGEECIASICVYPSEMTVEGRKELWAQLLTVGTLPEYRKQGIQRELWKRVQEWIDDRCSMTFLFTDETAAGFYEQLGFKREKEFIQRLIYSPAGGSIPIPRRKLDLDCDADFALVKRLVETREPVSDKLGFINPNLTLFMLLYVDNENCYYNEYLDTLMVMKQDDDRLTIYDIISARMPDWKEIAGLFRGMGIKTIDFMFCTDRLGLNDVEKIELKDGILFVSDSFSVGGDIIFPATIKA